MVQELTLWSRICLSRALVPALQHVFLGGGRVTLGPKLATSMLASGSPGRGPTTGKVQPQPVPCLGPHGTSHKAIRRCLPLMLGLEIPERQRYKLWLAVATAGLRAAQQEVCDMPKPDADFWVSVNL